MGARPGRALRIRRALLPLILAATGWQFTGQALGASPPVAVGAALGLLTFVAIFWSLPREFHWSSRVDARRADGRPKSDGSALHHYAVYWRQLAATIAFFAWIVVLHGLTRQLASPTTMIALGLAATFVLVGLSWSIWRASGDA
jgi:hypothetical protein